MGFGKEKDLISVIVVMGLGLGKGKQLAAGPAVRLGVYVPSSDRRLGAGACGGPSTSSYFTKEPDP